MAQHSDRLARGDGRNARHTVEIALWALKHDVRVRTLQDPETFRDLLYAVVTGQRNNEDSSRRGLASQAGTRRAAARGEFIGHLPDGYLLRSWLDEREQLCKEMLIDPRRRPVLELIFRLALRGRSCGQIVASLNKAGWLTKPVSRRASPRPFDVSCVYRSLKNPRYAGLSVYRGETLAHGCWPAYISERQHERILALLGERRLSGERRHQRESYLLARLARCGRCGAALHAYSGRRRRIDGSRARSYLCSNRKTKRGAEQCDAPPLDAHLTESFVVASLSALLAGESSAPPGAGQGALASAAGGQDELRAAALAGDEQRWQRAIEGEFARMQPHVALIRDVAISQRQARELTEAKRLRGWIEAERLGRSAASRAQCAELNALLRGWFTAITIEIGAREVTLRATRRPGAGAPRAPSELVIDRAAWARSSARVDSRAPRYGGWAQGELIGALQGWADVHGRAPRPGDWQQCEPSHPCASTVRRRFSTWERALRRAGLAPAERLARHEPWARAETIAALRQWARRHGRAPAASEWTRASARHPCVNTVRKDFGSWQAALGLAGLQARPYAPRQAPPWGREAIIAALHTWAESNGRAPLCPDWVRSAPGRPCTATVYKRFGSWGGALAAAGL